MKNWSYTFFIFLMIFTSLGWANDSKKCADLLIHETTQIEQEAQIKVQAAMIDALTEAYHEKLGLFYDAFAMAWTLEKGEQIFKRLSIRSKKGKWEPSPLARINQAIKNFYVSEAHYDPKLIENLIEDTHEILEAKETSTIDLQSNLLALKYGKEYLNKFKSSKEEVDRDGQKEEEKKE